jgi:hypothetical protein
MWGRGGHFPRRLPEVRLSHCANERPHHRHRVVHYNHDSVFDPHTGLSTMRRDATEGLLCAPRDPGWADNVLTVYGTVQRTALSSFTTYVWWTIQACIWVQIQHHGEVAEYGRSYSDCNLISRELPWKSTTDVSHSTSDNPSLRHGKRPRFARIFVKDCIFGFFALWMLFHSCNDQATTSWVHSTSCPLRSDVYAPSENSNVFHPEGLSKIRTEPRRISWPGRSSRVEMRSSQQHPWQIVSRTIIWRQAEHAELLSLICASIMTTVREKTTTSLY